MSLRRSILILERLDRLLVIRIHCIQTVLIQTVFQRVFVQGRVRRRGVVVLGHELLRESVGLIDDSKGTRGVLEGALVRWARYRHALFHLLKYCLVVLQRVLKGLVRILVRRL